ncbi:hypothetical protein KI387_012528, partial [Taxus chinensis]
MGICETIGTNKAMFWMVDEGIVDVAGAIDVADTVVITGMGPSYEMIRDKAGVGSAELEGADAE